MRGWAEAVGSCGELVQGRAGGTAFHVSCPVNVTSRAEVEITARPGIRTRPHRPKTAVAVAATLRRLGHTGVGADIRLSGDIPLAKGMAGSTADMAAACQATAASLGRRLAPADLAAVCLSVEPTDGTVFPGIVAFDHESGRLMRRLGPAPALSILLIEDRDRVDTISFSATKRRYSAGEERRLADLLALAARGIAQDDPEMIGRAATGSSLVNQGLLPKRELSRIISLAERLGGYGVVVAHSGTVAGVLHDGDPEAVRRFVGRRLTGYKLRSLALCDGGVRIVGCG